MPWPTTCPEVSQYERLASGKLSDIDKEALLGHLEACEVCAQKLATLPEPDTLVGLVRHADTLDQDSGRNLARLVERVSKLRPVVTSAGEGHALPPRELAAAPHLMFACPACGKRVKVRAELAGKKVNCPGCQKPVTVPLLAQPAPPGGEGKVKGPRPPRVPAGGEERTLRPQNRGQAGKESLADAGGHVAQGAGRKGEATQAYTPTGQSPELWDFLAPAEKPDEIGRLGPYRVLKVLGAGGMGVVFQAEDPRLERKVAVKAMLPALAASETAKQRFLREAKTAAAISHDHIVHIYQVGEDQGVPFMAMQFLEGEPLDDRLKRDQVLPPAEVLRIGREIAGGLQAAHDKGLIHRDIKPANIWLEGKDSRVKILDFGLARAMGDQTHLTQSGAIVGTPAYMAPEQACGKAVDHRCDLFSLGCVLYRMSTGEMPFKGADTLSILSALALESPPAPCKLRDDVPRALSNLVMQLLAKKPEERPDSAQVVAQGLEEIEKQETAARGQGSGVRGQKAERRRLALLVGSGVLGLGVLAATIVLLWPTSRGLVQVVSDDPSVEIVFDKNGPTIKGTGKEPITLRAGEHGVLIKRGDFVFEADTFVLKKGQTITLKVELLRDKVHVTADGRVIGAGNLPPVAVTQGSPAEPLPKTFTNSLGMEFVLVPRGKSWLGGGGGKFGDQEVEFTVDFYLGKYEVTQEEWEKIMGVNPSHFSRTGAGQDAVKDIPDADLKRFPVEMVSWNHVQVFLKRLNIQARETGWLYRLPKEAEWEYACRGGPMADRFDSVFDYYFDKPRNQLQPDQANFDASRKGRTCKVGSYQPNRLGLYDMHGNLHEWCDDAETAAVGVPRRMLRGGGWNVSGAAARASFRYSQPLSHGDNGLGLRLARVAAGMQSERGTPADALRREDIPAAVLASLGQGDPKRAPAELVAVLGDGRFRLTGASHFPAFSPDGTLLAVPSGEEAFLFDAGSGQLLRRFTGHTGRVWSVAFSPNGAVLAVGDEEIVRLWDPRRGVLLQELSGHARGAIGLAFMPDSQTVLSYCHRSGDHDIRVWDVTTGRQSGTLACKAEEGFVITPDGRQVVVATLDGRFQVWSIARGEATLVATHSGPELGPPVSVSADGRWLASGGQNKLKVWKLADLVKKDAAPFFEKQTPARWLQFDKASNKLWTADRNESPTDYRASCWDPASGQLVSSVALRGTDRWMCYALSPDGRTLAAVSADSERMVQLYDTQTGKPRFPDPGHAKGFYSVAFSPDGRWLASASVDNTIRVWDLATGTTRHKLEGHPARAVTFSPDSTLLASGGLDGTIALWDPATGARVRLLNGFSRQDATVRFSPDGTLLAAGTEDGGIRFWYARNGEEARTLRGLHAGNVLRLAFSADGQRLASGGSDGKLVITDLASGKVLHSFQRNTAVTALEFSSDGESVAAGYCPPEPVLRVWNLKDKDFVSFKGHSYHIATVSLRSDGRLAVTASGDGSVRLWEIGGKQARKMVLGLGGVGEQLWLAALSADGRYVATGNSNGTIYVFRLPALAEDIGEWLAARGSPPPGLAQAAWLQRVKGLSVANVIDAVSDRLRELNPGFEEIIHPTIEDGVVTRLDLSANVKDIAPLQAFTGLRTLICVRGSLADLSPLKGMKLTELRCHETRVSDLSPLKDVKLTVLNCNNTLVAGLSPLKNMKLTELWCQGTQVSDLSPLKDMQLTALNVSGTRVSDLSALKDMKLTTLLLAGTRVSDLSPLKDMQLVKLWCHETQVTDDGLVHLKGMTRLQVLFLSNSAVTDAGLVHLKGLMDLRELELHQTKVTDAGLEHLAGLKNLVRLTLSGTAVTDKGVKRLKAALPACSISR